MHRALLAGLLAVAMVVSPAYAATGHKKNLKSHAKPHKSSVNRAALEDAAWGGAKKASKKTPAKKAVKTDEALKPTVKLNDKQPKAIVAAKPETKPDTKPDAPKTDTVAAPNPDAAGKTAEDLEKSAQTDARRNPGGALRTYEQLLQNNPNYAYSGDVYANMYGLAQRTHADLLTQLKYAGMAGQKLQAGMSRRPVTQQQVRQFQNIEEALTNKWIEIEIQKIMAGKE